MRLRVQLTTKLTQCYRKLLEKNLGGGKATIISIAHRLDTVMDADKILVMEDGRVGEYGQSKNYCLKNKNGIFTNLLEKQVSQ